MKTKMRKITLAVFLLCALSMMLLTAGGQQERAAPLAGEVKILVPQSPGVPDGVKAVADLYMAKKPEISITLRSVPFNRYKEQLQVMWASNDVDDIITTGSPDIRNFAFYGALMPLDDILPPSDYGLFVQSVIDAVTFEGNVYAYPFREAASAMFYNKDYFAMAGIEAPESIDKPWTWQEWLEAMLKVRTAVKRETGRDVWGITFLSNPGRGDFWLTPIIRSNGVKGSPTYRAISDDGLTLSGYADTPEAMEAYRFYQDLYTKHKLAPTAEVPDAFATGQAITFQSFMASANQLERNFPDLNWGLMPLPYFKTPLVHTGGFTYSVSAKSKNAPAAKDFILFACSEEGIMKYFDTSGSDMVSRLGFAEAHPQYYQHDYQRFFVDIMEKYGEARPLTPGYVMYNSIMGFNLFMDLAAGADIGTTVRNKIQEFEAQVKALQ